MDRVWCAACGEGLGERLEGAVLERHDSGVTITDGASGAVIHYCEGRTEDAIPPAWTITHGGAVSERI